MNGFERAREKLLGLESVSYDYDYPEGLDLKPGSELHDDIITMINERAHYSHTHISNRFASWRDIDRTLNAYIRLDEKEEALQDKDDRRPVSIVFPNSYAILESMLSYMMTTFGVDPLFTFEGVSPEDEVGATLMQYVIQQQSYRMKMLLNLHTQWRDAFAYGFGVVGVGWKRQRGMVPVRGQGLEVGLTGGLVQTHRASGFKEGILFEGNELINIDPYLTLPDPSVGIHEVQKGEQFGWVSNTNLMELLKEEQESEGTDLFNARYLKHIKHAGSMLTGASDDERSSRSNMDRQTATTELLTPVDVVNMYVKLIPADYGLGHGEYPEIWSFKVASDAVVLQAKPLGLFHNKFPVAVAAPEYDGYGMSPISRLEIQGGLQKVLDFLFNSHIANVRKSLNDMFVVDPFLVNVNDVKDPRPGKIIRLRKAAWGKGVKDAVHQLNVSDVTRGHVADTGFIVEMMKQLSGSDSLMGNLRQGGPERLTSTEFQGTQASAVSRLDRVARLISLQSMQDLGELFASHTQQMMSEDVYVKTVGRWPEVLERELGAQRGEAIAVHPADLRVSYDVKVGDGSNPNAGNFSASWIQLFQTIGQNPDLMRRFDVFRIFAHIARGMGAKNVDSFEVQQMPDQMVAEEAQAGNLVPVSEGVG